MQELFKNHLQKRAEKLKADLATDAMTDFCNIHKNSGLTPAEIKELADKYWALFLAQELQFCLTKQTLVK